MTAFVGPDSEPYSDNWSLVKLLHGSALERNLREAGWTFFFMAAEVKVRFFGKLGAAKLQNAVKRLLSRVQPQHFNGLEVTGISARHFLGLPYTLVTAHCRHAQRSCYLESAEQRLASQTPE